MIAQTTKTAIAVLVVGKFETLGSNFSQETPKGATGVPATVKMFFLSIHE